MKFTHFRSWITLLATTLLFLLTIGEGLRSTPNIPMRLSSRGSLRDDENYMISKNGGNKDTKVDMICAMGSSLPDCSHACGPCFPCKRVIMSFKCSVAESCPIVYRCLCRGKYFHVPSH